MPTSEIAWGKALGKSHHQKPYLLLLLLLFLLLLIIKRGNQVRG